jgi:hypothetical protein
LESVGSKEGNTHVKPGDELDCTLDEVGRTLQSVNAFVHLAAKEGFTERVARALVPCDPSV